MFNTPSPSDNEIRKAETSIPNIDELAYDIVKSLESKNIEDRLICDTNIRERSKIIKALQSTCDHVFLYPNQDIPALMECRKCAKRTLDHEKMTRTQLVHPFVREMAKGTNVI